LNLRPGVSDKYPRAQYGMSSAPTVYKNFIFTGAQVQEGPSKGAAGDIRGWDMRTGKLVWTFHTVPRPAAQPRNLAWKISGKAARRQRLGQHDHGC
jgi:quinoprotein glucose dehydrogenase